MKKKKPGRFKEYNFRSAPFIVGEDEVKPYGRQPFKSKDLKGRMDEWQDKFNDYFTGLQENGKQLIELREQQKENGKQLIELREQQKENGKQLIELREQQKENGKQLIELREQQKEISKLLKEVGEEQKETDRLQRENARRIKEVGEQQKKTDQQLKEVNEQQNRTARTLSNLGLNIGDVAEDYFVGALKSRNEVAGIRYDYIRTNEEKGNGKRGEYDILLLNHETIIVVEVKHKLWKWHVDDFHNRRLAKFKELFSGYADRSLLGALAGLTVQKEAQARAVELGYLVLTQSGQKVKVLNPKGFEPIAF